MKLLFLFILLFSAHSQGAVKALSLAVEPTSIRVEYIESTNRGIIYVYGCPQCSSSRYSFSIPPRIHKQGKAYPFKAFLTDYWREKYPTLILDPDTQAVLSVVY